MGLFNFGKSKKETASVQNTKQDDIAKRWQEAYEANPRAYEKDDSVLIGFALTEDTDSLFPLSPEKQWSLEGKTISQWMITMVSLTKDGIVGQMEYHEAMKRLQPYVIASGGDWVLIRGLTYEEMDGLFEGLTRELV